jgi:4-amino-4-deoxy-L-arabinose transferase-like glycosyltransferase
MPNHPARFSIFQRLWKPAAVTGAGGTAIAIWFDEIALFADEILALIFLPILAGVIYLLDIFIFKSRLPRREDLDTHNDKGTRQ